MTSIVNKNKIFNDPIYGFISLPGEIIFDLIEHPYFQRLRRISQLGLTYLVYPGAYHTRFHHALGAMHLMTRAVAILREKGHEITNEEAEAVYIAILLHDVGHGPFSHALESAIIPGVSHEWLSIRTMERLNEEMGGRLSLAIRIFKDQYPKKFLHQLISSQLDMDRLDYLRRDSFYTGVTEGAVNSERLLTMLNVANDNLVIDAKGIYSVEKFIMARSLMYWQVYLHKTVLSAEFTLVKILKRAKELARKGDELFCSRALHTFLYGEVSAGDFDKDETLLSRFMELDDVDIMSAVKEWCHHDDLVLRELCQRVVNRRLLKVKLRVKPFEKKEIDEILKKVRDHFQFQNGEEEYLVIHETESINTYNPEADRILLLYKDGTTSNISESAEQLNIAHLQNNVTRHFICFPEELRSPGGI